jgi:hypothetical protein
LSAVEIDSDHQKGKIRCSASAKINSRRTPCAANNRCADANDSGECLLYKRLGSRVQFAGIDLELALEPQI